MEKTVESFVKEDIEMDLFSVQIQENTARPQWSHLEHPLVLFTEDEPRPRPGLRPRPGPHQVLSEQLQDPAAVEETLIEMEALRSLKISKNKTLRDDKPGLRWKKQPSQRSRFVVKDLVFLPRDQYLAQMESLVFSQSRDVSPLRARMTVDHSWTASQMDGRLRLVLRRELGRTVASRVQFTYLQCVQSSRSLFVPSVPEGGWSGASVLRISALGPLFVLIQQEQNTSSQVEHGLSSSHSEENGKNTSPDDNESETSHKSTEELREELQTTLTRFTGESSGVELPLLVRRGAALPSALKFIRRSGFCFRSTPIVSFCGEETEGNQGPLREFFRLMLQELQQTSLFQGRPGRLLLTSDLSALEDWRFYEAGLLIGWSLAHGGAGPRCLHPALYQLMCGQRPSLNDFSWRDVSDMELQSHLLQLQSSSDVKQLSPGLRGFVSSCGGPGSVRAEELPEVYRRLVQHYIYDRVSPMIHQFTQGLNSCDGLWELMRAHWEAFVPVMTSAASEPLSLEEFRDLFTVSPDQEEEETLAHWEMVLTLISDGEAALSFEDLLMFITGVDHLPPLGFSGPISLRFYSQTAGLSSVRLPFASSCSLQLFLPAGVGGAAELMTLLTRSVQESQGFTHLKLQIFSYTAKIN